MMGDGDGEWRVGLDWNSHVLSPPPPSSFPPPLIHQGDTQPHLHDKITSILRHHFSGDVVEWSRWFVGWSDGRMSGWRESRTVDEMWGLLDGVYIEVGCDEKLGVEVVGGWGEEDPVVGGGVVRKGFVFDPSVDEKPRSHEKLSTTMIKQILLAFVNTQLFDLTHFLNLTPIPPSHPTLHLSDTSFPTLHKCLSSFNLRVQITELVDCEKLVGKDMIELFTDVLEGDQTSPDCDKICEIIDLSLNYNPTHTKSVFSEKFGRCLISILGMGVGRVKHGHILAFSRFISTNSIEIVTSLVRLGAFPILLPLLRHPNPDCVRDLIITIFNILLCRSTCVTDSSLHPDIDEMMRLDGVEQIMCCFETSKDTWTKIYSTKSLGILFCNQSFPPRFQSMIFFIVSIILNQSSEQEDLSKSIRFLVDLSDCPGF